MKKIILLLILLITVILPQEIEKQFQFAPDKYYGISLKGNIVYAMSDFGLLVLEINSENKYVLLNTIEMSFPNPSCSLISDNNLILVCGDSVKYLDITNSVHPQFINQWKFPLAMKKIVKFGERFIIHNDVKYFLISIDNDSLRIILDIPNNGNFLAIDYPYLIMPVSPTLELYKISSGFEFYLEQVIEVAPFNNAVAGKGIVAYLKNEYVLGSGFQATTKVRSLTQPGFSVILETKRWALDKLTLDHASKFFYSTKSDKPTCTILNYSSNFLAEYTKSDVVLLDTTNRYFVVGEDFRVNNRFVKIFDNYYALSQKHRIIQHSGDKIYLVKNDDATNILIKLDSLESADTLSVRDSIIILRNKNSVKVYGIDKNNFFFADSFTISNAVANYEYFGNILVWYRNTSFEVHRRNGNTYSLLFSKTTLPQANKSFIKDSSLFIVDPSNGVGIYSLKRDSLGYEKWRRAPDFSGASAAITGDILWLRLGYSLFAFNISDLNIPPVAIDSLVLSAGYHSHYDFIVAGSSVYIRGMSSYANPVYKSLVTKVSLAGDSLKNNYTCLLPVNNGAYQLTESHKTLMVAHIKNLFWIRDTSIVSGMDYTETGKAEEYSLEQNYPNPFNAETMISYSLPREEKVSIKIYDILGSEIITILNDTQPAGTHKVRINSAILPSGIYFYRITAGTFAKTKKMVLLK